MENNKNIDPIQHEKLKLHIKYIVAIALILLFGGIVLATSNQNEFVNQVSFASTITSIILSVIAIWMSISGERSTNDIRISIAESTERLSSTSKEIKVLNKRHKKTIGRQLDELKNVQEQLTQIIQSINNVEKQVSYMYPNNATNSNTMNHNSMDADQKYALFNSIYSWITCNNALQEFIFCKMAQIIIQKYTNHTSFTLDEILYSLSQSGIDMNFYIRYINICWGIINTLLAASVFNDNETVSRIMEIINSKLNPQPIS